MPSPRSLFLTAAALLLTQAAAQRLDASTLSIKGFPRGSTLKLTHTDGVTASLLDANGKLEEMPCDEKFGLDPSDTSQVKISIVSKASLSGKAMFELSIPHTTTVHFTFISRRPVGDSIDMDSHAKQWASSKGATLTFKQ